MRARGRPTQPRPRASPSSPQARPRGRGPRRTPMAPAPRCSRPPRFGVGPWPRAHARRAAAQDGQNFAGGRRCRRRRRGGGGRARGDGDDGGGDRGGAGGAQRRWRRGMGMGTDWWRRAGRDEFDRFGRRRDPRGEAGSPRAARARQPRITAPHAAYGGAPAHARRHPARTHRRAAPQAALANMGRQETSMPHLRRIMGEQRPPPNRAPAAQLTPVLRRLPRQGASPAALTM